MHPSQDELEEYAMGRLPKSRVRELEGQVHYEEEMARLAPGKSGESLRPSFFAAGARFPNGHPVFYCVRSA
jgi:hypothetical protein